jgi:hypothetical protein
MSPNTMPNVPKASKAILPECWLPSLTGVRPYLQQVLEADTATSMARLIWRSSDETTDSRCSGPSEAHRTNGCDTRTVRAPKPYWYRRSARGAVFPAKTHEDPRCSLIQVCSWSSARRVSLATKSAILPPISGTLHSTVTSVVFVHPFAPRGTS